MCSADHSVIYGKVSLFDRTLCMDLTRGKQTESHSLRSVQTHNRSFSPGVVTK